MVWTKPYTFKRWRVSATIELNTKGLIANCSLKPYNIKGKTVTTNAVDSTAVLLSVMITQTISGLEGQCHLSGNCSTAWEIVALLGKL